MTARPRDLEVVRWLRRPLWWLLAVTVIGLLYVAEPFLDHRTETRIDQVGVPVEGTVLGSWDGGRRVPVTFEPPGGGEPVTTSAWAPDDADLRVGPVDLLVDPEDPTQARVAGPVPFTDVSDQLTFFGPMLLGLGIWLVTRHRCVRRSERLAASEQPAYLMVGVPVPGRFARRRWRLHLYPLDVAPGAAPTCTVPVVGDDPLTVRRLVEVKGEPRPGGALVAIEQDTERIWWPAGRALLTGRAPLPEPRERVSDVRSERPRWWLLGLGALLIIYTFFAAEDPTSLEDRSETVTVTVVEGHGKEAAPTRVRYRVDGKAYESTPTLAGPQHRGDTFVLRYDPTSPTRTWQPGTDEELPGTTPPLDDLAFALGVLLVGLGVVYARTSRSGG